MFKIKNVELSKSNRIYIFTKVLLTKLYQEISLKTFSFLFSVILNIKEVNYILNGQWAHFFFFYNNEQNP